MKIAVYSIAQNEEQFAERFMKLCNAGADMVLVGLSPSTDRTAEILQDHGAQVLPIYVKPWRFDHARNAVLACIPQDVDLCIALDFDEMFIGDWRQLIEKHFTIGRHSRLRFRFVHSFNADGSYAMTCYKDFIHQRSYYEWRHAVHERVYWTGEGSEAIATTNDLICEHHPDNTKLRRRSYRQLLEIECKSPTVTSRHLFWLARDYMYEKDWDKVLSTVKQYLATYPEAWAAERAWSHIYAARAHAAKEQYVEALSNHLAACYISPTHRDPWVELAYHYGVMEQWPQAYGAICHGLSITVRPANYLACDINWSAKPHDFAGLASHKLGMLGCVKKHLTDAIQIAPNDQEIRKKAKQFGVTIEG